MPSMKPIKIWGQAGPNPPKIAMLVGELAIPHEIVPIPLNETKTPEYLAINPNGRVPAIYDPNTDLTLWESGAIMEYLIEKYDTDRTLSYAPGSNEAFLTKQWLYFQVSGQGPYYGQAAWFKKYHPEQVKSALDRYMAEMKRVTALLDGQLRKQRETFGGEPWLVGEKMTYADIAFIPFQLFVPKLIVEELKPYDLEQFKEVAGWMERMIGRPAVKKVLEQRPEQ